MRSAKNKSQGCLFFAAEVGARVWCIAFGEDADPSPVVSVGRYVSFRDVFGEPAG